jgi:hypothetical protein
MTARLSTRSPAKIEQPADLLDRWRPLVRELEPYAELDFSFSQNAITICDMRAPASLRYGKLFTTQEITDGAYKPKGELERRVRAFMDRA